MSNQRQIHTHIDYTCNNRSPDLRKFYVLARRISGKGQSLHLFHRP
jgi:hypothetical protein